MLTINVPEGTRQISVSVDAAGKPIVSTRPTVGSIWHPLPPSQITVYTAWDVLVGEAVARQTRRRAEVASLEAAGINPPKLSVAEYEAALDSLAAQHVGFEPP